MAEVSRSRYADTPRRQPTRFADEGNGASSTRNGKTEYVYVSPQGRQRYDPNPELYRGGATGSRMYRFSQAIPDKARQVDVPHQLPRILGNRPLVFYTWLIALGFVSYDELVNRHTLPRPARLWETTWVYAGLTAVSMVDAVVPIANLLAVGYTIALLYKVFAKTGDFAPQQGAPKAPKGSGAIEAGGQPLKKSTGKAKARAQSPNPLTGATT